MKKTNFLGIIFLLTLGLTGCQQAPHHPLVGKWKVQNTENKLVLNREPSFELLMAGKKSSEKVLGQYSLANNQITFQNTQGAFPDNCRGAGVYTFQINGNQLTFQLINDQCTERVNLLKKIWTRQDVFEKIVKRPSFFSIPT